METKEQNKLKFFGVDIINVKYSATSFNEKSAQINLSVDSYVYYPNDLQGFQIITNMKLHIENVFELDLTGVGNFAFTDETPEELKKELINKNATAIMFPYLRSFVSTFSASCGMILGHLVIPIQFFQGDLKEIREPSSKEIVSEVEKKAVK